MKFFKNASKKNKLIMLVSLLIFVMLCSTLVMKKYIGTVQKSTHTVKVYENMAENNLAEQVREYIKAYSFMDEEGTDAVADVAVQDYNTILNSGVTNVTDEHTKAIEESIKKALEAVLPETELTEEDFDYLSNGICQIIWNALLEELADSELLNQKYEEEYLKLTESLQKQIDELAERSTSISITANIKKDEEGISEDDLANAKSDIYSGLYSEISSMKESIKTDVTTEVKYSLQGTTQGRYLTGGVPPVRFSM